MYRKTTARPRKGNTYQLDVVAYNGSTTTRTFDSMQALARGVCRAKYEYDHLGRWDSSFPARESDAWLRSQLRAFSRRGKALDVPTLHCLGQTRRYAAPGWPSVGYTRRQGPVHGIRKWRGGNSETNCRTMALRRQNAGWFPEEGEVECRATRRPGYLFTSWDGRGRTTERNWKTQHKGRKAWDRPLAP